MGRFLEIFLKSNSLMHLKSIKVLKELKIYTDNLFKNQILNILKFG